MCLGVPGKVLEVEEGGALRQGRVAFGGVIKQVCLEYVPEAGPGDYVLVHVGFAISRIDEQEAQRVFELLGQLGSLEELGETPEVPGGEPEEAS